MKFKQLVDQEQNLIKGLSSLYYKPISTSVGGIFLSSESSSVYWVFLVWWDGDDATLALVGKNQFEDKADTQRGQAERSAKTEF